MKKKLLVLLLGLLVLMSSVVALADPNDPTPPIDPYSVITETK